MAPKKGHGKLYTSPTPSPADRHYLTPAVPDSTEAHSVSFSRQCTAARFTLPFVHLECYGLFEARPGFNTEDELYVRSEIFLVDSALSPEKRLFVLPTLAACTVASLWDIT
jgi:hypothetical protein